MKTDHSAKEPVGICPLCQGKVFETDCHFKCENTDTKTCKVQIEKVILRQSIGRDQVKKLLANGKTDLLPKFISTTGRPFAAFLLLGKEGQITFKFKTRTAPSEM